MMEMQITADGLCITATHPAFLISIVFGIVLALVLAVLIARLERPIRGDLIPKNLKNLIWFAALSTIMGAQLTLLNFLFQHYHPGAELCTSLIWGWFFLPPAVLFISGAIWGSTERKRIKT
jgi:hypothetical protein